MTPEGTIASRQRDDLEVRAHDAYVEIRFTGSFSLTVARQVVDVMVAAGRKAGSSRLLLDCRAMVGPMSVTDRYEVAEYGARTIERHVTIAVLGRPDQILPDRFFENVAVSRGVRLRVFTDEDEAVTWISRE